MLVRGIHRVSGVGGGSVWVVRFLGNLVRRALISGHPRRGVVKVRKFIFWLGSSRYCLRMSLQKKLEFNACKEANDVPVFESTQCW